MAASVFEDLHSGGMETMEAVCTGWDRRKWDVSLLEPKWKWAPRLVPGQWKGEGPRRHYGEGNEWTLVIWSWVAFADFLESQF